MLLSLLQLRRPHLRLQHLLLRSRLLRRHLLRLHLKRPRSLRQLLWRLRLRPSPLHRPPRLHLQRRPQSLRLPRSHLLSPRNKRNHLQDPDQFRQRRTASHCDRLLKMLPAVRLLNVQRFPGNNGPASPAHKGPQPLLRRVPARSRNVRCLLAIVVRFQQGTAARCPLAIVVRFLPVIARAARAPVSPCVRSKADRVAKVVLIPRAPADQVVPAARKIALRMDSVQA